jgi:hypothetical protein
MPKRVLLVVGVSGRRASAPRLLSEKLFFVAGHQQGRKTPFDVTI